MGGRGARGRDGAAATGLPRTAGSSGCEEFSPSSPPQGWGDVERARADRPRGAARALCVPAGFCRGCHPACWHRGHSGSAPLGGLVGLGVLLEDGQSWGHRAERPHGPWGVRARQGSSVDTPWGVLEVLSPSCPSRAGGAARAVPPGAAPGSAPRALAAVGASSACADTGPWGSCWRGKCSRPDVILFVLLARASPRDSCVKSAAPGGAGAGLGEETPSLRFQAPGTAAARVKTHPCSYAHCAAAARPAAWLELLPARRSLGRWSWRGGARRGNPHPCPCTRPPVGPGGSQIPECPLSLCSPVHPELRGPSRATTAPASVPAGGIAGAAAAPAQLVPSWGAPARLSAWGHPRAGGCRAGAP